MPVQVSCEVSVFQYGNDRRDQILLHRKFPPSHILPMSAKGLSISFNPVKVCSAEHAWHDPYLIYRLQSMRPTHILRHSWLGCGWLSVSRMRPRMPGHLAIVFLPANHRFFTHFGEDHCCMSSMHSILESPPRKRSTILTAIIQASLRPTHWS